MFQIQGYTRCRKYTHQDKKDKWLKNDKKTINQQNEFLSELFCKNIDLSTQFGTEITCKNLGHI